MLLLLAGTLQSVGQAECSSEMGHGSGGNNPTNKRRVLFSFVFVFFVIDKSCKCTTEYFWISIEIIIKKKLWWTWLSSHLFMMQSGRILLVKVCREAEYRARNQMIYGRKNRYVLKRFLLQKWYLRHLWLSTPTCQIVHQICAVLSHIT